MRTGETMSGLTTWQVVLQSATIHPEWDAGTHRSYLVNEEGIDAERAQEIPIEAWLTDPTHAGYLADKAQRMRESVRP